MTDKNTGNHVYEWLNAYYDGELHGRKLDRMEEHLVRCPECRRALAQFGSLSALLQTDRLPALSTTPEQFAAQVALRLPRQMQEVSRRPSQHRPISFRWVVVPLGIMAMIWFLRSVRLVTNLLAAAEFLGIHPKAVSWLLPVQNAPQNLIQSASLAALDLGVPFDAVIFIGLILPLILAGGYMLWLVVWWVNHDQQEMMQSANGSSHSF